MMLTSTTLSGVSLGEYVTRDWKIYKPARVKMAVRMICCRAVVRRRHRSGIGWRVSALLMKINFSGAYQYENQEVENDVSGATAD